MNKKYNLFPKLIECRELLGYTQSDMADIAGVSPETYKKHERGLFDFRLTEMLAITVMKSIILVVKNYKQI